MSANPSRSRSTALPIACAVWICCAKSGGCESDSSHVAGGIAVPSKKHSNTAVYYFSITRCLSRHAQLDCGKSHATAVHHCHRPRRPSAVVVITSGSPSSARQSVSDSFNSISNFKSFLSANFYASTARQVLECTTYLDILFETIGGWARTVLLPIGATWRDPEASCLHQSRVRGWTATCHFLLLHTLMEYDMTRQAFL